MQWTRQKGQQEYLHEVAISSRVNKGENGLKFELGDKSGRDKSLVCSEGMMGSDGYTNPSFTSKFGLSTEHCAK